MMISYVAKQDGLAPFVHVGVGFVQVDELRQRLQIFCGADSGRTRSVGNGCVVALFGADQPGQVGFGEIFGKQIGAQIHVGLIGRIGDIFVGRSEQRRLGKFGFRRSGQECVQQDLFLGGKIVCLRPTKKGFLGRPSIPTPTCCAAQSN